MNRPQVRRVGLADGSTALFYSGSVLLKAKDFPTHRTLNVDGEFWIRAAPGGAPLVVRSRLLVLTVTGPARFHLVARSADAGEQVEVLQGQVVAAKNYASSFTVPDELGPGEMSMVNESIDLQEKERLNGRELAALRQAVAAL
jgi:hypothetical protein